MLTAIGSVSGIRCLDVGCGFGDLSRMLSVLGADVEAFDVVGETIDALKAAHPGIRWFTADAGNLEAANLKPGYGTVVATEVLQYVDPAGAIRKLFSLVARGGRLVGCVPNAGCPLVNRAAGRFGGRYSGMSIEGLMDTLSGLDGVNYFAWQGAVFRRDQELFPYHFTPWRDRPAIDDSEGVPNRLLFVAMKA